MATFINVSDPILDLSAAPLRDESIEGIECYEYRPRDVAARMNLNIVVNNTDQYTLPSEAYFQIAGKLVKAADGSDYADTDVIALINNGIMTLFENFVYRINDQEVEAIYGHGDVASTILGLVR